jgi:hypothetical protein
MKMPIAGTLAAALVLTARAAFAQTTTPAMPASPSANADRAQDHAEHHQQWEDCMAKQEGMHGGKGKGTGQHAGAHKGGGAAAANSKEKEANEPKGEGKEKGEGKKENRHQEEMQNCREQLYGKSGKEPAAAPK